MQYCVTKQISLGTNRWLQRVGLHHRVSSRYLHSHASLKHGRTLPYSYRDQFSLFFLFPCLFD